MHCWQHKGMEYLTAQFTLDLMNYIVVYSL